MVRAFYLVALAACRYSQARILPRTVQICKKIEARHKHMSKKITWECVVEISWCYVSIQLLLLLAQSGNLIRNCYSLHVDSGHWATSTDWLHEKLCCCRWGSAWWACQLKSCVMYGCQPSDGVSANLEESLVFASRQWLTKAARTYSFSAEVT